MYKWICAFLKNIISERRKRKGGRMETVNRLFMKIG